MPEALGCLWPEDRYFVLSLFYAWVFGAEKAKGASKKAQALKALQAAAANDDDENDEVVISESFCVFGCLSKFIIVLLLTALLIRGVYGSLV